MGVAAIVTAAGTGLRMRSDMPKQFMLLGSIPVLVRVLQALGTCPEISTILPVVPSDYLDHARRLIFEEWNLPKCQPPVPGGPRRQDSVRIAFELVADDSIVLIHDGARPFVTDNLIHRCIEEARSTGAALSAVRPPETVKLSEDGKKVDKTLPREHIWLAQTPQAFRCSVLSDAYRTMRPDFEYTDEASLVEQAGHPVALVEGEAMNIKITTPEDLVVAESILMTMEHSQR